MRGFVTLLGAGPGDAELLTVKGVRRLKEADVVVYDRLINSTLLTHLSPSCEKIDVGKKPGMPCVKQKEIESILIQKASEGKKVVRLKSGDPYIFGRGGEEGLELVQAGIDFEIVPGISSAVAALTYAGIPMTYRDIATSFHVFTGHLKDEMEALNWQAISRLKGTLVFLMGMKNLETIVQSLREYGFDKSKAVAIIEWGTHPQQRSIDGTLATILDQAREQEFKAPSVIVVGDVVAFRQQLNFYEQLPLFGHNILIQASSTGKLPRMLKDVGARIHTFPERNKIQEEPFELPELTDLSHILIADTKSWEFFVNYLRNEKIDIRDLKDLQFSALGHHTAKAIEAAGILLYEKYAAVNNIPEISKAVDLVLTSTDKLSLIQEYYNCPVIATHRTAWDHEIDDDWSELDAICLPNSVAAMNFVTLSEQVRSDLQQVPIIIMGESTRYVLEKAGFQNLVQCPEPTITSLCETCIQVVKGEET